MAEADVIPSNFDINDYITLDGDACTTYGGSTSGSDEGKLRFFCETSHLAYDDPIVYPDQPGAAHLHHFFGNTLTDAYSTYESLRTTGDGSCQGGPINRTGYWMPAMIRPQNNKVVNPDWIELYYTMIRDDLEELDSPNPLFFQHAVRPFPRGLKFIWGWKTGDVAANNVWQCEDGSASFEATIAEAGAACPSNQWLIARTNGPRCWDGTNLDSANHRDHIVFQAQDGFGNLCCPATHPHLVPELTLLVAYSHNGSSDLAQWYLSSDRFAGEDQDGGFTFHTDWFGAWDQDVVDIFSEEIHGIGTGGGAGTVKTSVTGSLCTATDQRLKFAPISVSRVGEPGRYLDIPELPFKYVFFG